MKPGVLLLAAGMVAMGAFHLLKPKPFVAIMPEGLPAPAALVALSGVAEVAGGVGLLMPRTRRAAGWGLAALYVAVFPANVHMALHRSFDLPPWILWARLPLQVPLVAWALWAGRQGESP